MRRVISILLLAGVFFVPLERLNVADLEPVEVVAVYRQGGQAVLETDTGDRGVGEDAAAALADMKSHTPTVIYLDTARFLLVGDGAELLAEELRPYLKKSVRVAGYNGGDLADEAKYAHLHNQLPKLKNWNFSGKLPG